jgi:C4-dicarboxylate transporter, DctQ subunit
MTRSEKIAASVDMALRWTENFLIATLSLAALALGTMQVVLRYLFNTGFHWNEAAFVLTTVTAMLAAGSRAVRENAHVRVDILATLLPGRISRRLDLLAYVAAFLLCAFYVYCGVLFVQFAWMMGTVAPDTGLADWVVFSIVPLALLMFCLRYLLKIRAALLGRDDPGHGLSPGGDPAA